MTLCDICKEPAVRRVTTGRDGQTVIACYCYVHAAESGVLEVPLDLINRAAAETGYPMNALIFVLESLIRAGCITEAEKKDEVVWTVETRTPLEACVAVSRGAVEQFQQQAGLALNRWKLTRVKDLGFVLSWLVRSGALTTSGDGTEAVLGVLSTMEEPLLVEQRGDKRNASNSCK